MGRIIFNEDPNHFVYSRYAAGYKSITPKDCEDFILQYKDTDITDFMICVNASIPWYDSVYADNIITQYKKAKENGAEMPHALDTGYIGLLADFYDRYGKVPQDFWIEALRKIGVRPWTSIRMNDIHESDKADSILFSDFYRKNRGKNRASHRGAQSYYEYALDYTCAEVREHYLSVIADALERFDTDGLELDWMREIYSVRIGKEYEGAKIINEFMRSVYGLVKRAEKARGHKISVAVRLPATPEKALRLGFDVFCWVENGWIDLITATPRWSSSDSGMPIDIWKKTFSGRNVTIAAGLEILLDAYNRRGRKYEANTYETAVAAACAYLWQGADAIYLFNYMDTPLPSEKMGFLSGEAGKRFFTTVGDLARCTAEKRRHVLTYSDVSAPGVPESKALPLPFNAGEYKAFRIPTGEIPSGRRVLLILGVAAAENISPDDICVYVSARRCTPEGECAAPPCAYTDMRYFTFVVENDGTLPPVSVVEISGAGITVHWAEIDVL